MLEFVEHLLGFRPLTAVGGDNQGAVVFFLRVDRRDGFVFALLFIGDLNETEAELGDAVFEETLFFGGQIAFGFFLKHAQQIDGMAGQGQVHFDLVVLSTKVEQAELHLRLHEDGFNEKQEICRRNGEVGGVCHTKDNVIATAREVDKYYRAGVGATMAGRRWGPLEGASVQNDQGADEY